MGVSDVIKHPQPSAQHHLRPIPETASFRHLKEVGINSLPFRPMRTWHGHKVDGEACETAG